VQISRIRKQGITDPTTDNNAKIIDTILFRSLLDSLMY
jgi:hypothetical protein